MKVKDAWYFNYTQKESEILQPDMAVPESHVGIYCEFEELVFPISFHILGMCKGEVVFDKDITAFGNGDDADIRACSH